MACIVQNCTFLSTQINNHLFINCTPWKTPWCECATMNYLFFSGVTSFLYKPDDFCLQGARCAFQQRAVVLYAIHQLLFSNVQNIPCNVNVSISLETFILVDTILRDYLFRSLQQSGNFHYLLLILTQVHLKEFFFNFRFMASQNLNIKKTQ